MDAETKKKQFDIVDGPSKDALFDACKYAYSRNAKLEVKFTVAMAYTMSVDNGGSYWPMKIENITICGISHEDGSGEKFILNGYCRADMRLCPGNVIYTPYRFDAFYNAKTRKGFISFTE